MNAYEAGDIGLNKCASEYGIPKATLKRHIDGSNKYAKGCLKTLGRQQVLPEYVEEELVKHILTLENMFFGVTRKELMRLAFQVAERNGIPHVFNAELKSAGKTWYKKFMKRHEDKLRLRQPEATSIVRASGFNRQAVADYFDLLEGVIDKNKLTPLQIYNMDESGISVVQKRCQKIIGLKGKHQIGVVSSAERGINTTVVCCFNAAGMYVPPIIIFKRKRLPPELKDGAPCGSIVTCNEISWMSSEIFLQWLQHYIAWVKPSSSKPILLVLDGHSTHVKNLKAILLARSANVIMLSLPPHTTHKAQPLDKTFFKPLQTYYDQAVEKRLRVNVGRAITPYQVCRLFNEAYCKAATMTTAINGFSSCGIWPCSQDVFCESEFQPSFSNFNQPPVSTLPPQQPAPATTQPAPASTQPAPATTPSQQL